MITVSQPANGWLEIEQIGTTTMASFNTRRLLQEDRIQAVGRQLLSLAEEAGHCHLILNFAAVDRLSTEMLGKLMALHRKVQARGGRLALCNLKPQLFDIFKFVNLHEFLTVYADEQEALQNL